MVMWKLKKIVLGFAKMQILIYYYYHYAMNKLRLSVYLCTPSDNPLAQFVHPTHFYLFPKV